MRAPLLFALVAATGCPPSPASTPPTSAPAIVRESTPASAPHSPDAAPSATPIAPRVPGAVGDMLDAYDGMQAKLAADDAAGAVSLADKLATSARTAAEAGTPATKPAFGEIATVAEKMKPLDAKDVSAVRMQFGELSKSVVALMVADPSLQTGRSLFMCPMTKTYQKWVQTSSKLQNPYFGKSMLDCGEQLQQWAI